MPTSDRSTSSFAIAAKKMQPNHLLRVIGLCVCVFGSAQAFAQGILDDEPTGRSDDLLARVTFENGEPVSGIRAEVQIKRTVGMFTGRVGDVAPEIYELKIQAPIQILP